MKKCVTKFACAAMAVAMSASMFASCGSKKGDVFFIGGTAPLTGDASTYGIAVDRGAKLAVKEINEQGGINGYKIKLDIKDDEADSLKASNAYSVLYEDGMQLSLGSTTSSSCLAFADLSKEDNLFFMTPSASTSDVIKNDNAFRMCFGDPDQGILSADRLSKSYTKIGVVYNTSDPYSKGVYDAFMEEMKNYPDSKVEVSTFKEGDKDFKQQISNLKNAKCEVVYLPIYYNEANLLIREAVETQNWQPDFFGCDGLDGLKALLKKGDFINTVTGKISYMTPFNSESQEEKTKHFVEAFKAEYNEIPSQFAANAYDVIYLFKEALTKAEVKDVNIEADELCKIMVATITDENFKYVGVTGETTWKKNGAPSKTPAIVELSN